MRQPKLGTNLSITQLKTNFIEALKTKNSHYAICYASHLYKQRYEEFLIETLSNVLNDNHVDKIYQKEQRDLETKTLIEYFWHYNNLIWNKTDVLFLINLILHQCIDYSSYLILDPTIIPLTYE